MKTMLLVLALLAPVAVIAQEATSTSQSGSQSGAQSGSTSGATVNVDLSGPASITSSSTIGGGTNNTDNVKYSGSVENKSSGGTHDVIEQSVRYSGTQTVKNVPGIAMSGPASGPCTGASGGVGVAGPGFGVGLNGAKVDDGCTVRENTRVLGQLFQSLDSADPLKAQAKASLAKSMAILDAMNDKIGGEYLPKPAEPAPKKAEAPAAAPVVAAATPAKMVAPPKNEPTDPFVRARLGLPKL
jgi:hypothetical protein